MVPFFSVTIFLSAFLLFCVQPMVGKMILPLLGGTPAVWNTCLLFFQAVLLLGYLYAYASSRWLNAKIQSVVQLVLIGLAVWCLPIAVDRAHAVVSSETPITSELVLLLKAVGLPFLVLSSFAPLLQRWFHHTTHGEAHDPYFLYSASNTGSLLALLSYPFLVEPYLHLSTQTIVWKAGYILLGIFVFGCSVILWRNNDDGNEEPKESSPADSHVSLKTRLHWIALSFVPSGLLLAVTNHLTRDLSPIPLLWVVPLALYIGTFAIVFARKPILSHETMLRWQPFLLFPPIALYFLPGKNSLWLELPIQLAAFFVNVMVCHGELVKRRPHASRLTEFYLWISFGGALGGFFVSIVAPAVFKTFLEFPILYLMVLALRPGIARRKPLSFKQWFILFTSIGALLFAGLASGNLLVILTLFTIAVLLGVALLGWLLIRRGSKPLHIAVYTALILAILQFVFAPTILFQERNFFGPVRVLHNPERRIRILMHGVTVHGVQGDDPEIASEPLAYFHPSGPFGTIYKTILTNPGHRHVGIVGLGTGAQAMFGQEGDQFTFYEIDPLIVRIAEDDHLFTYLKLARCKWHIVMGDARLSLTKLFESPFDLLVLDAFSSDAIPVHLLTREAMQLYKTKVKPDGLIAFQITNYYLDLRPVLAALVKDAGWVGYVKWDQRRSDDSERYISSSMWVITAASPLYLGSIVNDPTWVNLDEFKKIPVWTDDFSNLVRVVKWPWSK